jgi:hypothetical protein
MADGMLVHVIIYGQAFDGIQLNDGSVLIENSIIHP